MARERSITRFNVEAGKSRPGQRREKYTRQACEVCQTRKVKCSGLLPCSRCVELDIDCLYKDPLSSKSTTSHPVASGRTVKRQQTSISSRSDLGHLVRAMRKVCDDIESSASKFDTAAISNHALKRSLRHEVSLNPRVSRLTPGYVALLSRAQGVLHEKGMIETSAYRIRVNEPATDGVASVPAPFDDILRAAEPIIHLGQAEALRYLAVFKDHIYSAYPFINLDVATKRLTALYSARAPPGGGSKPQDLGLDIIDVELMKATLAIAMMLDKEHDTPLCRELDAHLLWNTDFTMNEEHAQVEDVIMATLLTIYLILKDKPLQAWRMIGLAARTSLELDLHTERPVENIDEAPRLRNHEIFSCVYDLDMRCSFFADLRWTLHYKDIDAQVLNVGDQHSYLSAMLGLNRVHTEVANFNATTPHTSNQDMEEQTEVYDHRTRRFVDKILAKGLFPAGMPGTPPVEVQNAMTSIFQLRANQIRTSAYIHYLSNSYDGEFNNDQIMYTIVSLAISSVDIYLSIADDISLLWRPLADRLLMHSISCMFLAASKDPQKYGPLCRKSFHAAIDRLIQSDYKPSKSESVSWCSLDDMRSLAGKIQMPPCGELPDSAQTSSGHLNSATIFENDLSLSVEELAQLCGNSGQSCVSTFSDAALVWENQFNQAFDS